MLNTEYISGLPKQRILAAAKICEDYFSSDLKEDPRDVAYTLEVILGDDAPEKLNLNLSSFDIIGFKLMGGNIELRSAKTRIENIHRHVKALQARDMITGIQFPVDQNLIEMDQSEIQRIEELLSEIRELVRSSEYLDEDHKLRLIKIVSNLQREIDKPVSSYREFLNGMIETSEALGTSGENVKPVFDRMREVFGIADKAKKKVEQLSGPEETKRLPSPESVGYESEAG